MKTHVSTRKKIIYWLIFCFGFFASRFERPAAIDPNTAMIARDGLPKAAQCVMDNFAIETKRVLPAFPGIIAWR